MGSIDRILTGESRLIRPFEKGVDHYHGMQAFLLNRWSDNDVEYRDRTYRCTVDETPEDLKFKDGHRAGKIAAWAGFLPVIIALSIMQFMTLWIPWPLVEVSGVVLLGLYAFAGVRLLTELEVTYELADDEVTYELAEDGETYKLAEDQ